MSEFKFTIDHKIVEADIEGQKKYAVQLLTPPYIGIIVSYGKVSLDEDDTSDVLRVNFEYDLIADNDADYDITQFEQHLGELLQELIKYELSRNNLVFAGGTDETRTDNIK